MHNFMHRARRFQHGQAVVEFAFILPLLLLLILGITELGRMIMRTNLLTQAAREGARAAAVGADSSSCVTRVTDVLASANVTPLAVDVTGPDANNMMSVVVTSNYAVLGGGDIGWFQMPGTLTLRGSSMMRLEN
jgi:Flp pilus assembly protein TadG